MTLKNFLRTSLLALLIVTSSSQAGYLCDPECRVVIAFANGGSIEAVETTTFVFGASGLIDTGSTSTAYLKDETLTLNQGESLVFGAGGSFSLGDLGNIDYSHLIFNTDDRVTFSSGPNSTSLIIDSGQTLGFKGGGNIRLGIEQIIVSGTLIFDDGTQATNSGSNTSITDTCAIDNTSGAVLSFSNSGTIDLTSGSACSSVLSNSLITETSFSIDTSTNVSGTIISSGAEINPVDSGDSGTIAPAILVLFAALQLLQVARSKRKRQVDY